MYVVNFREREVHEVTLADSTKTTMRWLVGKSTGARTYAMRHFEIAPGGVIPLHSHDEEHEIFILTGKAKVLGGPEGVVAQKDDIVYVAPNEPHGYDNTEGKVPFTFICVIPLLEKE